MFFALVGLVFVLPVLFVFVVFELSSQLGKSACGLDMGVDGFLGVRNRLTSTDSRIFIPGTSCLFFTFECLFGSVFDLFVPFFRSLLSIPLIINA